MSIDTIIFDLGGVLIDWNPRYVYRQLFNTEEEVDYFLQHIATPDWNEEQDAGRTLENATEFLVQKHSDFEEEIRAYYGRWEEMLGGEIIGTVEILKLLLSANKHKLLALTNWSSETFPKALELFEFLNIFEGIVVSGIEKMKKPDHQIYQLITDRYSITPSRSLFIDDNLRNIESAAVFGFQIHHFTSPQNLDGFLREIEIF